MTADAGRSSIEPRIEVSTADELSAAVADSAVGVILVRGVIANAPTLKLLPGQQIIGEGDSPTIEFRPLTDGVRLSSGDAVRDLALVASPAKRALFNDPSVADIGTLEIRSVETVGTVQILTEGLIVPGAVQVSKLDIRYADATAQLPQAAGFGVSVLQGVFTLWNQQAAAVLTAEVRDISIGRRDMPAFGGGVFVAGFSQDVISLEIPLLTTGDIFIDGRIPAVQSAKVFISSGVAVSWGAHAREVICRGVVDTFGNYDMVLDNWGKVDRWIAEAPLTSYGKETAIGFVNYGEIGELAVHAPIETFGAGSRGFNEYNGSLESAEFRRITTHGDAAPGIQVGCPVKRLKVREGIETFGGSGTALVSGKFVQLPAYGLSVIPGGVLEEIAIEGGIVTHGSYTTPAASGSGGTTVPVATLDLGGSVGSLSVSGGLVATATAT